MLSVPELQRQILRLVFGELTLDEFDEWFSASSWNMHKVADEPAQVMASEIELLLAEHSARHLSDDALVSRLWELAGLNRGLIVGARAGVSTPIQASAGYLRFELQDRRIENYSSQAGTHGEPVLRPRRLSGSVRIDTGKRQSRPA